MKKIILLLIFLFIQITVYNNLSFTTNNYDPQIEDIRSNSTLEENGYFHSPIYLIDSTERSWCEGLAGDGIGEGIIIEWNKKIEIDHLYIKNGFGKSEYFYSNNRVKKILLQMRVIINEKGHKDFINIGTTTLKDTSELQKVDLPKKIFTDNIKIIINSVYRGTKFRDTCLSEISLKRIKINKYNTLKKILKPLALKRKYLAYTIYPNGTVRDNGSVYFSQCDSYFVKGAWGWTNDGRIFVKTIKKIRENCGDVTKSEPGKWRLFSQSYIFDKVD